MSKKRLLATAALTAAALLCAAGTAAGSASASTTPATTTTPSVVHPGGPMIATSEGSSTSPTVSENWSGYATTSSKAFTYVHSTFVQPAVTCPGVANQWTSNWVGLDGYNDQTVEQDGTFVHCGGTGNTTPKYEAWYEMYPANSVNLFAVHPGDIIDTSVSYSTSTSEFTLTVTDLTTGKSGTDSATCATCVRSSAEWIIERPALCNAAATKCFLTALADFGTSTMGGNEAQLTGGNVKGVGGFNNTPIYMIDPLASGGFISLDTVTPLSGQSFTADWDRSGTTTPITLGRDS